MQLKPNKPFQFYLSDQLKRRLLRQARAQGLSLGAWIRYTLTQALKKR